ncbi:MAG: cytochrome c maturation protein CcmE [Acidimicrobiales bacterium]
MTDTSEVAGTTGTDRLGDAGAPGGAHEGTNGERGAVPPPPALAGRRRRNRLRILAVFAVLAAAVAYLLVEGLGSSLDYFDTVNQAYVHKGAIGTGTIRLEGLVVKGTIQDTSSGADFVVAGGGHRVPVHASGSPPQLFQPGIPVVLVGHFASSGSFLFLSDQIMVKHTASYIAQHPNRVRAPDGKVH